MILKVTQVLGFWKKERGYKSAPQKYNCLANVNIKAFSYTLSHPPLPNRNSTDPLYSLSVLTVKNIPVSQTEWAEGTVSEVLSGFFPVI